MRSDTEGARRHKKEGTKGGHGGDRGIEQGHKRDTEEGQRRESEGQGNRRDTEGH